MQQQKILNDPVYGFIGIPYGILFDLVEHPYFQRLRRIKQVSLTHYVYPGALHTRFHHALGAFHLMRRAIDVLRQKGVAISQEEAEAAMIAILLHDIGHGPFSHTLEHTLIPVNHEELSILFMQRLSKEFDGKLDLAMRIFQDDYHKPFLHQLVSGQLDMDRMDYLNRDSFFTGVSEGVIGYDRIISMLNVQEGHLVVEEKGIYSIEKFLIARRLMYWQVYLHKTVLAAELMLVQAIRRARHLVQCGVDLPAPSALLYFLQRDICREDFVERDPKLLDYFARLDDTDIASAIKEWQWQADPILSFLSYNLVQRRLFRLRFSNDPIANSEIAQLTEQIESHPDLPEQGADYFLTVGKESNSTYTTFKDEIQILTKRSGVVPLSQASDHNVEPREFTKYYICYPKLIEQKPAHALLSTKTNV